MPSAARFVVAAVGTTAVAVVAHLAVAYPPSLPDAADERRELLEVAGLFAVVFAVLAYAVAVNRGVVSFDPVVASVGGHALDLVMLASATAHVALPLALERGVRGRPLSTLGFRRPWNWLPALVLVAVGFGVGLSAVLQGRTASKPPVALLAALYTPVFEEELFYRGVVQSKVERALDQRRAWLVGGVAFGFGHVPVDFFGTFWVAGGGDPGLALARLASQIGFGLLFGVLYMQCRTLAAPVVAHYCVDELGGVVGTVLSSP